MKPIEEMNLAECLEEVELLNGVYEYDSPIRLALRINELTRWIPASERMPTPEDGKQIHVMDGFGIAFTIMQSQWDNYEPTHWKRLDSPY